jgi:transcriptional regulator with XRE-family HTH domain
VSCCAGSREIRRSPMKRYSYSERDYAFGQLILTLRTSIGLTQAGLAGKLGVSRRAVAEWEGGLSYPKAERLKQLIELGVQQQAFTTGRDEEEICALWKAAHRKVLLDERWLHDLLASPRPISLFPRVETQNLPTDLESASIPRIDLMGALDTSHFAGREVEVAELSGWIVLERCRLVTLLGMGGIGKSMLAS